MLPLIPKLAPIHVSQLPVLRLPLPALECRCEDISTLSQLEQDRPRYYILSADYARAVPPKTEWGQLISGLERGTAGYRRLGTFRSASPWSWLSSTMIFRRGPTSCSTPRL